MGGVSTTDIFQIQVTNLGFFQSDFCNISFNTLLIITNLPKLLNGLNKNTRMIKQSIYCGFQNRFQTSKYYHRKINKRYRLNQLLELSRNTFDNTPLNFCNDILLDTVDRPYNLLTIDWALDF